MVERIKITITVAPTTADYLKRMVENGEAASMGWAMDAIVKDHVRDEERKKKSKEV